MLIVTSKYSMNDNSYILNKKNSYFNDKTYYLISYNHIGSIFILFECLISV